MVHIVSCDPGHTSGLVRIQIPEPQIIETREVLFDKAYRDIAWMVRKAVHECKESDHRLVLVVEDFIGGGRRTAHAHEALKVHGFVAGLGTLVGAEVRVQVPQVRQAFIADAWTLWRAWAAKQTPHPKSSMHVIDALAHGLAAVYKRAGSAPQLPPVQAADCSPKEVRSHA